SASSKAVVGTPDFFLTCTNAPPSSLGLAIVADVQDLAGSDRCGLAVPLHVDMFASTILVGVNAYSTAAGTASAALPIPNVPGLAGQTAYVQMLWVWAGAHV